MRRGGSIPICGSADPNQGEVRNARRTKTNGPPGGSGDDTFNRIQKLPHRSAKMVRTNDPEVVWDKPNPVDDKWIEFIDENVLRGALSSCTHGIVLRLLVVLRAPRR